jgi:hypothetical protein
MRLRALELLVFAVLVAASPASAGLLTWTVNGATFDDGGVLSGSFAYDADTNMFSSVSLTTTDGSSRSGAIYIASNMCCSPLAPDANTLLFVTAASGDLTGTPGMVIDLLSPMTNAGGTIDLETVGLFRQEGPCTNANCTGILSASNRFLTAGSITAAPEPSAWLLTAVPLAVTLVRRRYRSKSSN